MAADVETAKRYVVDALVEAGAAVFAPIGGRANVDLAVRGNGGFVEVDVKPGTGDGRQFVMGRFRPRPQLFIVGVVFDGATPSEAWLLPSGIFERFSDRVGDGFALDLDADDGGEPLSERLTVYRNRWKLITEFAEFRSTLTDPVALQIRLALG